MLDAASIAATPVGSVPTVSATRWELTHNATATLTEAEWQQSIDRFSRRCYYCGGQDVALTIDHALPLRRGGAHDQANIIPSCLACNIAKGQRTPAEYADFIRARRRTLAQSINLGVYLTVRTTAWYIGIPSIRLLELVSGGIIVPAITEPEPLFEGRTVRRTANLGAISPWVRDLHVARVRRLISAPMGPN